MENVKFNWKVIRCFFEVVSPLQLIRCSILRVSAEHRFHGCSKPSLSVISNEIILLVEEDFQYLTWPMHELKTS